MGSWNDFNDAQSNTSLIPKGTLAKVRLTIRPGGFDDASQGWTGGYATRGSTGAVYLNGEFTVTWPEPGMYWLQASTQDDKTSVPQAKQRRLSYVATLEALPQ